MEGRWILSICIVLFTAALWRFVTVYWWRPRAIAAQLKKEGIQGPSPRFMVGQIAEIQNMRSAIKDHDMESFSHDIFHRVHPALLKWRKQYGKRFVFWWGTEPRISVSEPEIVREVLSKKFSHFDKSEARLRFTNLFLGRGLASVTGEEWSHHRRLVAPAFFHERIKKIPELLPKLVSFSWIPGFRFLPLPINLQLWKLHQELDSVITGIIDERRNSVKSGGSNTYGNDLLGLMLKECDSSSNFTSRDLIEECKTFYIAGHETTATLLTWTLMLLGGYPEWQERARAEVHEVCGNEIPDGESVSRLKLVGMILYETLRLYPPAIEMTRECVEESWLQDLHVPKGVSVSFPIIGLHQDKELWGEDAGQFNPDRFKDGISSACKHPNAFMPFSFGPRVCVGQAFAMIEAKVILAMILQRFLFRLSPNYRHNPVTKFGLKPMHGVPLVLSKM
ncbi:hypothetical protein SELMODRAFT_267282 [Selaginella moellendorffii]|uniref:Uncharacterized protein n=1 Tax=Selaginella moellendorffii TaxID=88036 RepID=D8REU2_SELML|nr:hypothetical protein SELMODRAFT_267282 [Selaginella moellendorffii]